MPVSIDNLVLVASRSKYGYVSELWTLNSVYSCIASAVFNLVALWELLYIVFENNDVLKNMDFLQK